MIETPQNSEGGEIQKSNPSNIPLASTEVRNEFLKLLKGEEKSADFYTVPQRLWDFLQRLNFDQIARIHRNEWNRIRELVPEEMKEFDRLIHERVRIKEDDHNARIFSEGEDPNTEKFVPAILPSEMLELTQIVSRFNNCKSEDKERTAAKELVAFLNHLFSIKLALCRKADGEETAD